MGYFTKKLYNSVTIPDSCMLRVVNSLGELHSPPSLCLGSTRGQKDFFLSNRPVNCEGRISGHIPELKSCRSLNVWKELLDSKKITCCVRHFICLGLELLRTAFHSSDFVYMPLVVDLNTCQETDSEGPTRAPWCSFRTASAVQPETVGSIRDFP